MVFPLAAGWYSVLWGKIDYIRRTLLPEQVKWKTELKATLIFSRWFISSF
jgi:hypothetical protein